MSDEKQQNEENEIPFYTGFEVEAVEEEEVKIQLSAGELQQLAAALKKRAADPNKGGGKGKI
jgi:hypothetical protein